MERRGYLGLGVAAALALAFPATSMGQFDGSLNTTFDGPAASNNGRFLHAFNDQDDQATDVLVQPDGKVLVVGFADVDLGVGVDINMAVARFNGNTGALDPTFDGPLVAGNGAFTLDLSTIVGGETQARAVTLDSVGRIVIGGFTDVTGSGADHTVVRLAAANGDFDDTFGNFGVATTAFSAGDDFALAVTTDASDRPITVGHTANNFTVARFESDGDPDTTFSADGEQTVDIAGSDVGNSVLVQPSDGKIVVGARTNTGSGNFDLGLARLNPADGSLDTSFDGPASASTTFPGDGKFAIPIAPATGTDTGQGLAMQGTDKILIGGSAAVGTNGSAALVRLDVSDGDLDTSFDTDGIVTSDFSSGGDQINDLEIDSKGRIVAARAEFGAARYSADGVLDPFFDGDSGTGNGTTVVSFGVAATAEGIDIASDGDLVLAGEGGGGTDDFALARLNVDLIDPNTFVNAPPAGVTNNPDPIFSITSTETASSVTCTIDTVPEPCTSGGGQQFGPFADGPHTFTAAAVDLSGNIDATPSSRTFTVDTVAPNGTITGGTGLSNDPTPSIGFSSNEAGSTFQCKLDPPSPAPPGSFAPCTSPFAPGALPDGAYTISVRTTDAATNVDASDASATFTIDTVAPTSTITVAPAGLGNDPTPSISFSSNDGGSTLQCKLDPPSPAPPGSFGPCASPFNAGPLPDGAYTFTLRNTDAAGNSSDAVVTFTIDTAAPKATITGGSPAKLKAKKKTARASFQFSSDDPGARLECSLDGAAFAACSSPFNASLRIGSHNFSVRARDAAGNVSAAVSRAVKVKKKKRKRK